MTYTILESELNQILKICINKYITIKKDKQFYINILELFPKTNEINISIKTKYNLIRNILKLLINDKSVEYAIQSCLSSNENFKQFSEFLEILYNEETSQVAQDKLIEMLDFRLKEKEMIKSEKQILEYSEKLKDGVAFENFEEKWKEYEKFNNDLLFNYRETRNKIYKSKETMIRIGQDVELHKRQIAQMKVECNVTRRIPTGIEFLDKSLKGGLEKELLTVIGGTSSSGKSILLLNWFEYASVEHIYRGDAKNQMKIFYYISLENPHKLTYKRLNSILYNVTIDKSEEMLLNDEGLFNIDNFVNLTKNRNVDMVIDYAGMKTLGILDIELKLERLLDIHKQSGVDAIIGGVYIDYLELLKSRKQNSIERFNYDEWTSDMKNLAIKFNCPIVTATQLNRTASSVKSAKELNAFEQGGESLYPYKNADTYVAIKLNTDEQRLYMKLDKCRDGRCGEWWEFEVDYERAKIVKDTNLLKLKPSFKDSHQLLTKNLFESTDINIF